LTTVVNFANLFTVVNINMSIENKDLKKEDRIITPTYKKHEPLEGDHECSSAPVTGTVLAGENIRVTRTTGLLKRQLRIIDLSNQPQKN
jgi:hypothetical protein